MNRLLLPVMLCIGVASAQTATISGTAYDAELAQPAVFANVVLYLTADSTQVAGTVTADNGGFELAGVAPGAYYLEVSFVGYETKTVYDIEVTAGARLDLGRINMKPATVPVEGATTVGEKPSVRYEIDKKVIEVSANPAVQSGTAVDALENAPSVNVDIEGNVTLRGSSNFTVLVDGKPTMLEPNEALKQLPASTIENIEIITNPSAKYDPDGAAGVINVVLKKQKVLGVSALSNANAGLNGSCGGDLLLGYRQGIVNAYGGGDYHRRIYNSTRESKTKTFGSAETLVVSTKGSSQWNPRYGGGRGGIELQLGERDRTGVSGMYRLMSVGTENTSDFEERFLPADTIHSYANVTRWGRDGYYFYASADHQHQFDTTEHKLLAQVSWGGWGGENSSGTELRLKDTTQTIVSGRKTSEDGPNGRAELKLNYTLPLREKDKLEAGYQTRFEYADVATRTDLYDTTAGKYETDPRSVHSTLGTRFIHSLFSTYSWNWRKLGIQAGIRGERGQRNIKVTNPDTSYGVGRWDYFPSLHASQMTPVGQVTASYSRRIERPWPWMLQPYETWESERSVRRGNPDLRPEFIDSWDAGFQTAFGRNMLSAELYYRVTSDMFTWKDTVYPDVPNVILRTARNVGTAYSLGGELMLNLSPLSWWGIQLTGDVYNYRVKSPDTSRSSFRWNGRMNNDFRLPTGTRIQVSGYFSSPSVGLQSQEGRYFTTSASVRQNFLNRALSVTVVVRDILGTGRWEWESSGDGFQNSNVYVGEPRAVTLLVTWNFNNFRLSQRMREGEEVPIQGPEQR